MLKRWSVFISLGVALVAYVWGLGSVQIPKIGDEVLYLQIARVTNAAARWLPLRIDGGILSTKPPLLYWLGIASMRLGGYSLWALRIPVVIVTFLGSGLVYLLSHARTQNKTTALWASLAYLGFISTYQHGRPFLVNSFEVLFLVGPLVVLFKRRQLDFRFWLVTAFCWGAVAWSKSFALIFVGALSLAVAVACLEPKLRTRWLQFTAFFATAIMAALAIFCLWFINDPNPRLLFDQFIIGENVAKFRGYDHYFAGLFSGTYPLYRIWLGSFVNAGLFGILLVGLVVVLVRKRSLLLCKTGSLNDYERGTRALLAFIAAFLIFYSIPTQRQENYILPAMAIWAVLLAEFRSLIPAIFWRVGIGLVLIVFAVLTIAPAALGLWTELGSVAQILSVLAVALFALILRSHSLTEYFPILVLLAYVQLTNFSVPFNRQFISLRDSPGVDLWVPSRKLAQYERFRFIAPGSVPIPYAPETDLPGLCQRLPAGSLLVIEDVGMQSCQRPRGELETVLDFKTRQTPHELWQIALGKKESLIRQLHLVRLQ